MKPDKPGNKVLAYAAPRPSFNTSEVLGVWLGPSNDGMQIVTHFETGFAHTNGWPNTLKINTEQWNLLKRYWGKWHLLELDWPVILGFPVAELETIMERKTL